MNTFNKLLAIATLALLSCGDNNKVADAHLHDTAGPDADTCPGCPNPPALGVQMDRLGRPAINTALDHAFDGSAGSAGAAKDAYNQDGATGTWPTTYAAQFAANLAILDVLDTGLSCTLGTCSVEPTPTNSDGCGNQVLYNGQIGGGGTAAATSYTMLAGILGDDQLYLDTTKSTCDIPTTHQNYLAVEFGVVTGAGNSTCGGRAPANDVMDTSYTALAIGINGFKTDGTFAPAFGDNVGPHADLTTTFPYLGAPH